MILTPPDFPDPGRAQRTFRRPPDSRITVPAVGFKAMYAAKSPRSSADQYNGQSFWNRDLSMTVSTADYAPKAHSCQMGAHKGPGSNSLMLTARVPAPPFNSRLADFPLFVGMLDLTPCCDPVLLLYQGKERFVTTASQLACSLMPQTASLASNNLRLRP